MRLRVSGTDGRCDGVVVLVAHTSACGRLLGGARCETHRRIRPRDRLRRGCGRRLRGVCIRSLSRRAFRTPMVMVVVVASGSSPRRGGRRRWKLAQILLGASANPNLVGCHLCEAAPRPLRGWRTVRSERLRSGSGRVCPAVVARTALSSESRPFSFSGCRRCTPRVLSP